MTRGILGLLLALALAGCGTPDGCQNSITGNDNVLHSACGGSGEGSRATVTTPTPVITPPTVITPVVVTNPEGP